MRRSDIGRSRRAAARIARRVDDSRAAFDSCPDWPDSPVDVRVEVEQPGPASVIRIAEPHSDGFTACIHRIVGDLRFPTAEENRVLFRIYPPDHWAR